MAEYRLAELAEEAGVPARTIRYYAAEGLLPPPLGGGKNTHYGDRHLESLRQIQAMKAGGFSLKHIYQALEGSPGTGLTCETWETFGVSRDVRVSISAPLPPARRQLLIREITRFAERLLSEEKDEQDGN